MLNTAYISYLHQIARTMGGMIIIEPVIKKAQVSSDTQALNPSTLTTTDKA